MTLSSFKYKEPGWELAELAPLSSVNLLVAKNATGKSRTVRAIQSVASFMQMKETASLPNSFEAELLLQEEGPTKKEITYAFQIKKGVVEKEWLKVGDEVLIERTSQEAKYKQNHIAPPAERLVTQTRRDKHLYPEIERLMQWAEGVVCVTCAEITPTSVWGLEQASNAYALSQLVDALSPSELPTVLQRAQTLGYHIASLKTIEAAKGLRLVQIKETSVADEMVDGQLSNGMLRTLYLLCFAAVMKHNAKLNLLLIDDLCEGLDYQRSVALGKMIFEDCVDCSVQLIASSNDAFLMDVVDIAHWQVLRRNGSCVTTINAHTHAELFRQFRMTGLSNFDLFSSDFIDSFLNKK